MAGNNEVWLGVMNDRLHGTPGQGCWDDNLSEDCRGTFNHIMDGAPIDHNIVTSHSKD